MRRHGGRTNSMWAQESSQYWEKHEPVQSEKKKSNKWVYGMVALVLILGGAFMVKSQFTAVKPVVSTPVIEKAPEMEKVKVEPVKAPSGPTEQVRAECKLTGAQSEWHQKSCANICEKYKPIIPRPLSHRACMDGCSFGTLTATTDVCMKGSGMKGEACPAVVSCKAACNAYANQLPSPAIQNYCESGCNAITASSCIRALSILQKLHAQI